MSTSFVNGEPLLSQDVLEATQFATDRNVKTTIATEGMIPNKVNSKKLSDAGLDLIKFHIGEFSREVRQI